MRVILLVGLMVAAAASANAAQDSLDAAKDLYASAAYEEALSTLSRLSDGGVSAPADYPADRRVSRFLSVRVGPNDRGRIGSGITHPPRTAGGTGGRRRVAPNRGDVRRRAEAHVTGSHSRPVPDRSTTARSKAICGSRTPSRRDTGLVERSGAPRRLGRRPGGPERTRRRIPGAVTRDHGDGNARAAAAHSGDPDAAVHAGDSDATVRRVPPPQSTPAIPSEATGEPRTYRIEDQDVAPPVAISSSYAERPGRAPGVPPDAAQADHPGPHD